MTRNKVQLTGRMLADQLAGWKLAGIVTNDDIQEFFGTSRMRRLVDARTVCDVYWRSLGYSYPECAAMQGRVAHGAALARVKKAGKTKADTGGEPIA